MKAGPNISILIFESPVLKHDSARKGVGLGRGHKSQSENGRRRSRSRGLHQGE